VRSQDNFGRFAASISLALLASLLCVGFTSAEPIQSVLVQDPYVPGRLIDLDPNGYTIQEIINAGGIIIGDKLFDAFHVTTTATPGAYAPGAAEIAITPVKINGNYGMIFNGGWTAGANQVVDSTIEFRATILEPGYYFHDNYLWITAPGEANTTGGIVSVSETVWEQHPSVQPQEPIASKYVYYKNMGDKKLVDSAIYDDLYTRVWIKKDVMANGGTGTIGTVALSEFYQTFSQVPEPSTFVLLAVGLLGMAGYVWRKRR
jgi:hypothetical protein